MHDAASTSGDGAALLLIGLRALSSRSPRAHVCVIVCVATDGCRAFARISPNLLEEAFQDLETRAADGRGEDRQTALSSPLFSERGPCCRGVSLWSLASSVVCVVRLD